MKTISITDSKEIENIIQQCPYCMVGITDTNGHPYVFPMNFAYEKGIIYLHSGPDGGKLAMLRQRPDVCITFCDGHELVWMHQQVACSYSMKSRSVICRGCVEFVEDMDEKRRILTLLMKHYTDYPCTMGDPAVRNVVVWRIQVKDMTCKSFGLRPSELSTKRM